MICKICKNEFIPIHFNQSLCSEKCKHLARKEAKARYKKSDKGSITEIRWRSNPKKKEIDKIYYTSEKGRAKAVKRITRLIKEKEYYLFRKRLGQTAPYRRLRSEIIAQFGECQCCRSKNNLTIDHIIALSTGGKHERENIQVLCRSCNSRKKQKTEKYELQKM